MLQFGIRFRVGGRSDPSLIAAVGNPEQKEAPLRSAHGYIEQHRERLDCAGALEAGLPIGSGQVESGTGTSYPGNIAQ